MYLIFTIYWSIFGKTCKKWSVFGMYFLEKVVCIWSVITDFFSLQTSVDNTANGKYKTEVGFDKILTILTDGFPSVIRFAKHF